MLRERRVNLCKHFVSRDPEETISVKLRKQLQVHSFQFKEALNAFQKSRAALPGKIGCLKDDIAICLQLSCFSTSVAKCQGVRCD